MRRWHLAVCLSVLVALLHVSLAGACINDSETVRTERDFKKHYEFRSGPSQPETPPASTESQSGWGPTAATLWGVGLLLGSAALVTFNVRKYRSM